MLNSPIRAALLVVILPLLTVQVAKGQASTSAILFDARDAAMEEVLKAARSDEAVLRANALEAAQAAPDRVLPLAQLALDDPNPGVRFAALATIGRLKLESLGDAAVRYRNDPNPSVRAAALFAAHRTGREVDISEMAQMLTSSDPTLRGNVAMLLGEIGEPSAATMLQETARVPMRRASAIRQAIVRVQVAEAMVSLGEESALDALRSAAYSQFGEVRVLAVSALGKLDDRRMQRGLEHLLQDQPIELRLAAAEALGRMGSNRGLQTMLEGAAFEIAPVRAQSAFALGTVDNPMAAQALVDLLRDPHPQVRLAAAASILKATAEGRHS